MNMQSLFKEAAREVEESGVASEFRPAAFAAAVQVLAGVSSQTRPQQSSGGPSINGSGTAPSATGLAVLAARLGLPAETVEAVYTEVNGEIRLGVDPKKISKSKSAGARELALLTGAARQATGEDQTSIDEFRHVAQENDRFDGPNFAAAMTDLKGSFIITGPSRQRMFKLTRPGWAAATELVRRLSQAG